MALLIRESDVKSLLTMPDAISALDHAFTSLAGGNASNRPRQRIRLANGTLHVMPASIQGDHVLGFKAYTAWKTGVRFLVTLYDSDSGELLAFVEADILGRIRTGAASGLASKYMAREDSKRAVVFGAGRQARTQLDAVATVRPLESVLVFGRSPEKVRAYCDDMQAKLGIAVEPGDNAEKATGDADVVITMTTSKDPVLLGQWLAPGTHVNAAGSNQPDRREVDTEAVRRSEIIAVDSIEQCRIEAGDLILAEQEGGFDWSRATELADVVAGKTPGRTGAEQITFFESLGLALEDIAAAKIVYQRAREAGMGVQVPIFEFLEGRG